jgi:hypothetical protein
MLAQAAPLRLQALQPQQWMGWQEVLAAARDTPCQHQQQQREQRQGPGRSCSSCYSTRANGWNMPTSSCDR